MKKLSELCLAVGSMATLIDQAYANGFKNNVLKMNNMYDLQISDKPTIISVPVPDDEYVNPFSVALDRLTNFKSILLKEVNEIDDLIKIAEEWEQPCDVRDEDIEKANDAFFDAQFTLLTGAADLFGDLQVYLQSEAEKYGINLEDILAIIMASNFSKLGADGLPIKDAEGKVCKGPNYWKPEPFIQAYLRQKFIEWNTRDLGGEAIQIHDPD